MLAVLGLSASPAYANSYFLKIGDIKGGSQERDHEEWIDLQTFNWSIERQSGPGTGRDRGTATPGPFSWTQQLDRSVPKQFEALANGKFFPTATLDVQRSTNTGTFVYFDMVFEDVMLTALNIAGNGGVPVSSGGLSYSKLTMTYRLQNDDGSPAGNVVGGFDFDNNVATFFGSPLVFEGLALAGPTASAVPVPAAVWLLGSALFGLMGFARRGRLVRRKA